MSVIICNIGILQGFHKKEEQISWIYYTPQGTTSRGFNINTVLNNIAVQKWRLKVTSKSDIQKWHLKVTFKSDVQKWHPKVTSNVQKFMVLSVSRMQDLKKLFMVFLWKAADLWPVLAAKSVVKSNWILLHRHKREMKSIGLQFKAEEILYKNCLHNLPF